MRARSSGPDLKFRHGFENDLIVVDRRVDGGDLAHAEGVVELLADLIDGDAVDRRLLAIDLDRDLRVLDVKVGGDVEQARNLRDLVAQFRRHAIERRGVVGLQRVLILALGQLAAEIDVLDRLKKDLNAGNDIGVLPQARADLRQAAVLAALVARLERHQHAAAVADRIGAAGADRGIDVVHRRIRAHDVGDLALQRRHAPGTTCRWRLR